jgi:pilus assembly protein CpaC
MTVLGKIRAVLQTIVVAALASVASGATAEAQTPGYMQLSAGDILANRPVYLGINKSVVIDLPRAAGDVLVSNPQIADAVLRTSSRLYLIGVALGQASVFLFDSAGAQIASFDVYVEADLGALNQLLAEAIPNGYVRAEAIQGSIVLRGQVPSATDASRAVEITAAVIERSPLSETSGTATGGSGGTQTSTTETFAAGSGPGIINLLSITGEEQVAIKVTVAEVQRSVIKQLGVNVNWGFNGDEFEVGTSSAGASGGMSPLPGSLGVNASPGEVGMEFTAADFNISATLQALDEANMLRTLAEPTLTAVSGETAEFLAGGEVPFITGIDEDSGIVSVDFKKFGVQLAFTPVVLSPGRISIRIRSEVSEVVSFTTGGNPVLSTRLAETTVEQPSGGAFVIAGLLQQSMQRSVGGFPGLRSIPILGALFSSKSYLADETELVMIVTPYLVRPTSPQSLARPDDNLAASDDAEGYFLNQLTKVYGSEATVPASANVRAGFAFE